MVGCISSYRVGVVIVVYSVLWMRKSWILVVSLRRLMFMSPMMVMNVCGDVVYM